MSMDLFFADPSEIPLPPEEVRIQELRAEPYPDGRRVRIYVTVDPFQRRPSLELEVFDTQGRPVASANVIESQVRKMEMTLHLRNPQPGEMTLKVLLVYTKIDKPEEGTDTPPPPIETMIVDNREITFQVVPAES
jgi:hypothetical protein